MITFFNANKFNTLTKTINTRDKNKKENFNTNFKGLNKDTFERSSISHPAINISFKGPCGCDCGDDDFVHLDKIEKTLNRATPDNFTLKDKDVKSINSALGSNENDVQAKAQNLVIDIGKKCTNADTNSKLTNEVIAPLLNDEANEDNVLTGINIVGEISKVNGEYANDNLGLLDPFLAGTSLSQRPELAKKARQTVVEIGASQPGLADHIIHRYLNPIITADSPDLAVSAIGSLATIARANEDIKTKIASHDFIPNRMRSIVDENRNNEIGDRAFKLYQELNDIYSNNSAYQKNARLLKTMGFGDSSQARGSAPALSKRLSEDLQRGEGSSQRRQTPEAPLSPHYQKFQELLQRASMDRQTAGASQKPPAQIQSDPSARRKALDLTPSPYSKGIPGLLGEGTSQQQPLARRSSTGGRSAGHSRDVRVSSEELPGRSTARRSSIGRRSAGPLRDATDASPGAKPLLWSNPLAEPLSGRSSDQSAGISRRREALDLSQTGEAGGEATLEGWRTILPATADSPTDSQRAREEAEREEVQTALGREAERVAREAEEEAEFKNWRALFDPWKEK